MGTKEEKAQGASRLRSILLAAGFEDRSAPVEWLCPGGCASGMIE